MGVYTHLLYIYILLGRMMSGIVKIWQAVVAYNGRTELPDPTHGTL